MSVIGKYGSGGGGGSASSEEKVKVPHMDFDQYTYGSESWHEWNFENPFYIESIEIVPLDATDNPSDDVSVPTRLRSLRVNGLELFYRRNQSGEERFYSMTNVFGAPVAVTNLYAVYARTDANPNTEGVRCVLRGYVYQ